MHNTIKPLKVDVLVDLVWGAAAGGHVKCWERLAEAATEFAGTLDLTVHFSGPATLRHDLSPHVRYQIHRPVFSTRRLPFLNRIPDDTDLAPFHPGLARMLGQGNVLHTTDAYFAFARTAQLISRLRGVPLVNSVHTETPSYTRVFTADLIRHRFGEGRLTRWLLEQLQIDHRGEAAMRRRLERHQRQSVYALVSSVSACHELQSRLGQERAGLFRRGVDRTLFTPSRRDRHWLQAEYGIPTDRIVVLCVGRVNQGKNVLLLAQAVKRLADCGMPVQLFCAGEGDQRQVVRTLLGEAATCPGVIERQTLARVYASADLFAMPSEIEVFANVVMEALASGLPSLVTAEGGMGRMLRPGSNGLELPGSDISAWEEAIADLITDDERRQRMALAAREAAERDLPSWQDVLRQDLLPVWRRAAVRCAVQTQTNPRCTAIKS